MAATVQITELGQGILNAIDAGARDIFDINAHANPIGLDTTGLVAELNQLRRNREIVPAVSPRNPERTAYQRTDGHVGPIAYPGAGRYPCGCRYVHDASGAVVQVRSCH